MLNHYKTLGVGVAASDAEIRRAYGALARQNHPDLFENNAVKAGVMAELNVAYNVLKDVKRRKEYDKQLVRSGKPCSHCKGKGVTLKQQGFSKKVATACTACAGMGVV